MNLYFYIYIYFHFYFIQFNLDVLILFYKQQIYRISTAVVSSATVPVNPLNPSSSKSVPFDAPATYFRLLLFQEGVGLDIASEMIREVYYDLWGMEKKKVTSQVSNSKNPSIIQSLQSPSKSSNISGTNNLKLNNNNATTTTTSTERKQSLPPITSSSLTSKDPNQFKLTRVGSDSRFPQLGVKSGSSRNLQQLINNESDNQKSSVQQISPNETYLHQLMNVLPEKNAKELNQHNESNDENENEKFEGVEGVEDDSNDNQEGQDEEGKLQENMKEPEESDNDEEEDDEYDLDSTFDIITEWKDRLEYEKIRTARDFLLYTLECFVEICENRMELQDRIAEKSPYLFESLHGMLLLSLLSIIITTIYSFIYSYSNLFLLLIINF